MHLCTPALKRRVIHFRLSTSKQDLDLHSKFLHSCIYFILFQTGLTVLLKFGFVWGQERHNCLALGGWIV